MRKETANFYLAKIKQNYNLLAKEFSAKRKFPWQEFKLFFEKVREGERVLDLGCGNGRFFPYFKEKKLNYFGVDFSEKLIEIAKKNYPEGKFLVANALKLPFADSFFDKVFAFAIFHHIPSKEYRIEFLKEIKRVLKKGGVLILTCWQLSLKKRVFLILKFFFLKLIKRVDLDWRDVLISWGRKVERYYHLFSKRELKKLAKISGFEIIEVGKIESENKRRKNIFLICKNNLPL